MKFQKVYPLAELLVVLLVAVAFFGWIWNILKLVSAISDPLSMLLLLRAIGILIAPLGVVLGFM